jgi:hypothetical protein
MNEFLPILDLTTVDIYSLKILFLRFFQLDLLLFQFKSFKSCKKFTIGVSQSS